MFRSANTAHFALHIPAVRNDFKVLAFDGVEAISALYAIQVELVSEHPDFDLESLLSQPAFLQFGLNGEGLHGRIEDVFVGEAGKRLTRYHLTLVPVLHYLQLSHNQRIFQNLTVPQIIAQVFKGHGIQADAFTFHVSTSPEREYCTQYGESDFELVQRLCAEDGIAWHHQHSPDGHLLVFTDDQTWFPKLGETPYQQDSGMAAEHPVVGQFSMRFRTRTSTVTRRDYDLKRPSLLLESRFTAEFSPELEDYRYPVFIENEKRGKQLARQALERHRTDYQLAEGNSDQPCLRSGHLFELTEHPRKTCNDLWLLLSVTHAGKQPQSLEEAIISDVKAEDGPRLSQQLSRHSVGCALPTSAAPATTGAGQPDRPRGWAGRRRDLLRRVRSCSCRATLGSGRTQQRKKQLLAQSVIQLGRGKFRCSDHPAHRHGSGGDLPGR